MCEPDWSEAPEWAEYFAIDQDGDMAWFEAEPSLLAFIWSSDWEYRRDIIGLCEESFDYTVLHKRP